MYSADFITAEEEATLLADIGTVSFSSFEMRGVVAKRRVAFFGHSYGRAIEREIPQFLASLRSRLAVLAGVQARRFRYGPHQRIRAGLAYWLAP